MANNCRPVRIIVEGNVFNMVCGCWSVVFVAVGVLYVGPGTLFSSVCLEIIEEWRLEEIF